MNLLRIITIIFIIVESSNVYALYFKKSSTRFNSTGVFSALKKANEDPEISNFVKYLINWVAGVKVIIIGLLLVITILGNPLTQWYSILALIVAISTFYLGLFPIIRKMEHNDQLEQKNYSKILLVMITSMIIGFTIGLIVEFPSGT